MKSGAVTDSAAITTPGLARLPLPPPAGDPAWLAAQRVEAARWVDRHGFPTRRDEDWRYLDLTPLLALPFEEDSYRTVTPPEIDIGAAAGIDLGGPRLVFVNGRAAPELCRPGSRPAEDGVGSLAATLADRPHELAATLGPSRAGWYHAFHALNAALATDGAVIQIPPGSHLEAPLHLIFLSLPSGRPTIASPRSAILAGAGSRVSVVVHHLGQAGQPVCTNTVTQVICAEMAQVDYTEVQDTPQTAYHLSLLDVHQAAGSTFSARTVTLGGLVARHEIRVALSGPGAETNLDGLYLPAGRQHHDHPVLVDHATPGATSRQLYKGVIAAAGRGVFNGHIIVAPAADGTDASQLNENLLLSERAEIDTRPRLEIHADDVRCTHGAAVGQLDPNALYYLRSRGIPRAEAERILVGAFAAEVTGCIPYDPVRTQVEARIAERFSTQEEADGR